jgi:DnaK suppressor protein
MQQARLSHFRELLVSERDTLGALAEVRAQAAGTVALDQAASGRVTRVDALQQQAMAQAELARAETRQRAIDAALTRISEGVYGECLDVKEGGMDTETDTALLRKQKGSRGSPSRCRPGARLSPAWPSWTGARDPDGRPRAP